MVYTISTQKFHGNILMPFLLTESLKNILSQTQFVITGLDLALDLERRCITRLQTGTINSADGSCRSIWRFISFIYYLCCSIGSFNILRPRQNGRKVPDEIFKCIFFNEKISIEIKIPLKFVPKGAINSILSLVQIMGRRRPGDNPLSEPMIVMLQRICIYASLGLNELVEFEGSWCVPCCPLFSLIQCGLKVDFVIVHHR